MSSQHWGDKFRDQIELIQIHRSPGNGWIGLKARLSFLTVIVDRLIDLLERAVCRVPHYLRPGFVRVTRSHRISVARPAVSPECLVRNFSHVRSTHHNRHSGSANRISHAVSLGYHPRHGADTDEFDVLFANESYEVFLIHRARVAVYE